MTVKRRPLQRGRLQRVHAWHGLQVRGGFHFWMFWMFWRALPGCCCSGLRSPFEVISLKTLVDLDISHF